jgi:hypothetical protein
MSFKMSKMKKCSECQYSGECGNEDNLAFENILGCWAHSENDDREHVEPSEYWEETQHYVYYSAWISTRASNRYCDNGALYSGLVRDCPKHLCEFVREPLGKFVTIWKEGGNDQG